MKIIFMGTPDFSIPSLKSLIESRHELALKNNLPVLQPEKLKNSRQFIEELKKFNADLYVVVAFRILPVEVFSIPPKGSFNLHASLLPKYRGAAPIQWALINGETETGLTTFKLAEKVDTGNIYLQEKVNIKPDDNFESLHDRLREIGSQVVLKTVEMIDSGNYELKTQDDSLATPAPKITKELTKIDWNKPAREIHNLIRGLSPIPGAYFEFKDKIIKVYKSEVIERNDLKPFQLDQTKTELIIGCGKDAIKVLQLQQEGKKRMGIEEFLRGFSFIDYRG